MAYTREQINRISADKRAVRGLVYLDTDGNSWKGTEDGRLVKTYTSDNVVSVKHEPSQTPESLSQYLENLNTYNDLTQEFLDTYQFAQKTGYKVFTYTGDNITEQTIYKSNTLVDLLYTVTYTYTGDNLTEVKIVKADGTFTLTKTLAYDVNNNLTNITLT